LNKKLIIKQYMMNGQILLMIKNIVNIFEIIYIIVTCMIYSSKYEIKY
jgi:hypothetical protein